MSDYDVITIGAGHNGLSASASLAKQGLKTINFEKNDVVGGLASNKEFWPGYKSNIGAWVWNVASKKVTETLELEKYGIEFIQTSISAVTLGAKGEEPLIWYNDSKKFFDSIVANYGPNAAQGFVEMMKFFRTAGAGIGIAMQNKPISIAKIMDLMPNYEAKDLLRRAFYSSAKDICDEYWPLDGPDKVNQLRAWLASTSVDGQNFGPMTPGSLLVLLYHMSQGVENEGGYTLVKGGMQGASEAIRRNVEDHGGEVALNSPVKRVLVKDNRAYGVELENGEQITAKAVLANTDMKSTFTRLFTPDQLPETFMQRVNRIKYENPYIQIYLKLNGEPVYGYQYEHLNEIEHANWLCGYAESLEYVERCWDDCKHGSYPQKPLLSLGVPSIFDPSLAPEGKHVGVMYQMFFPHDVPADKHDAMKEEYAEHCIDMYQKLVFPNFRDIIDDYVVWSNQDIARYFNCTNGDYFHGSPILSQMLDMRPMLGYADYRTPVEGFYMCGSNCHPSGGVTCIPGLNAADTVMSDWNKL